MHYAQYFNITTVHVHFNEVILQMPCTEYLVGQPASGAVHTGAISALTQASASTNAICAIFYFTRHIQLPSVIDFRIDHVQQAFNHQPIFARSELYQVTQETWHSRSMAYQKSQDHPIAIASATYI